MTVDSYGRYSAPAGRRSLRDQLRTGFRRCLRLTFLGTLIPGAGLTRTRARAIGWVVLAGFLLTVAGAAYIVLTRGVTGAGLMVLSNPTYLKAGAAMLILGGVVWCASIIATAVQSRPERLDRTRTRLLAIITVALVAFVGGGTYKGAEVALITNETIGDVFSAAPLKPGQGAKVIVGEPDVDPWRDTPRVNVLLIGSDAGADRDGVRTDSMIVASIDTKTGRAVLIQLPRSLEKAPLAQDSPLRAMYPSGFFGVPTTSCGMGGEHECLLTNLWRQAEFYKRDHPGSYPDEPQPGRLENRRTIELITGLKIDQEVIVDLSGFSQLINAMGGVDINVKLGGYDGKTPLPYGTKKADGTYTKYFTTTGRQHLDGYKALWYARTRAADDDTMRQSRQRCVVRAIVEQVNPAAMLSKYADIARIARNNIYTDIPAQSLPAFVELIERVQKARITSLPLTPEKQIYAGNPDYALVASLVKKAIAVPKPKPAKTASGTSSTKPATTPTTSPTAAQKDECA